MSDSTSDPKHFVESISASGLSIYDTVEVGDTKLWIPSQQLEQLLDAGLRGVSLQGLPLRTRSKVVKERVCKVLGYRVPESFKKTQPRFVGQMFDTYVQKSNNLQVWNEELSATRRYVLIRVSDDDVITRVKVVTGDVLGLLDTTGTLTQKFQARCLVGEKATELISAADTSVLSQFVTSAKGYTPATSPAHHPAAGEIIPIAESFERLSSLVGQRFIDVGIDQERNRGGALHGMSCRALGYARYQDDGQFPDIRHQLIEVKLQTSPTIDLGLVCPNSVEALDVPQLRGVQIRHCDVRYAVFYGRTDGKEVTLTNLFMTTGEDFFSRFAQFGGKVLNKKLQIPLPRNFFDR